MNSLYDAGRGGILDGSINCASDTIKACLVGAGYTPNLAADANLSDVPSGQIIATSSAFTSKSEVAGVFTAANIAFAGVTGPVADFIVIYKATGSSASSRLIGVIDTGTGLPVTPNGGAINVAWDTGANGIFKI